MEQVAYLFFGREDSHRQGSGSCRGSNAKFAHRGPIELSKEFFLLTSPRGVGGKLKMPKGRVKAAAQAAAGSTAFPFGERPGPALSAGSSLFQFALSNGHTAGARVAW